jgi:hypothetical protein
MSISIYKFTLNGYISYELHSVNNKRASKLQKQNIVLGWNHVSKENWDDGTDWSKIALSPQSFNGEYDFKIRRRYTFDIRNWNWERKNEDDIWGTPPSCIEISISYGKPTFSLSSQLLPVLIEPPFEIKVNERRKSV